MQLSDKLIQRIDHIEEELAPEFKSISRIALANQDKVLQAFQTERIGTHHFQTSTGYGYNDMGREALEKVFSRVFKAESSLVRQQLVSGTHAIACAILGNLSYSDELLIGSGFPYETLLGVLGVKPEVLDSISETAGFRVRVIPLLEDGRIDLSELTAAIGAQTKMIAFQRSCGYSDRPSISIKELQQAFTAVKQVKPDLVVFVDNCYGEFVEEKEPLEVGADLIAGSLIKNPGGCLIPSGGYLSGKSDLVEKGAERLFAPKIGGAIGPSLISPQIFFQGFFEAPHRVGEMVKGAALASCLFEFAGYKVSPLPKEPRTDIIQKIFFNSAEELIAFCQAVQKNSPVESHVRLKPARLPGYLHQVIMGGGTFITGSTSEFSADAPIIPPYIAFLQGGLSYTQIKLSLARIFESNNFGNVLR
jgi:cystathionine beta-lyase family protein involved in aluminum resistance